MKLFSASALSLVVSATSTVDSLAISQPLADYVTCQQAVGCSEHLIAKRSVFDFELPEEKHRQRRGTKKYHRRFFHRTEDGSPGFMAVKELLDRPQFQKIIRKQGAQAIVDPFDLNLKEQYVMGSILHDGKKLNGRELLYKLGNSKDIPDEVLESFKQKQDELLEAAGDNHQMKAFALVGLDIKTPPSMIDQVAAEVEYIKGGYNKKPKPFHGKHPPRRHGKRPHGKRPRHPSQNSDASTHSNLPGGVRPMENMMYGPNHSTRPETHQPILMTASGQMLPTDPQSPGFQISLKSALRGRGLPESVTSGRGHKDHYAADRMLRADPYSYKRDELMQLGKQARFTLDAISSLQEQYNAIMEEIQDQREAMNNDHHLSRVTGVKPTYPPFKAPSSNQMHENFHNDRSLAAIMQKKKAMLEANKQNQRPVSWNHARPAGLTALSPDSPTQVEKFLTAQSQSLAGARDLDSFKNANSAMDWARSIRGHIGEVPISQDLMDHNMDLLNEVAQKRKVLNISDDDEADISALVRLNFGDQYKVAMFLKDHDTITVGDLKELGNQPMPSIDDMEDYYECQQAILRGDEPKPGHEWMKKLKDTLWMHLKPDIIMAPRSPMQGDAVKNDDLLSQVANQALRNQKPTSLTERQQKNFGRLEKKIDVTRMNPNNIDLSALNFGDQYKIAMYLKKHDTVDGRAMAAIKLMPMPTVDDLYEYYTNQQKILRGERVEEEFAWMKKLKNTMWKELTPDPLPHELENNLPAADSEE